MKKIDEILRKSTKAICGITEREIRVPKIKVSPTIKTLKEKGFHVIGTSYGKTPTKKIWFIRGGSL